MRKKIAKIFGFLCVLGIVLMIFAANFLSDEYNYIVWWIGVVILILSVIPYLCTGEKPSELFWKLLDFL